MTSGTPCPCSSPHGHHASRPGDVDGPVSHTYLQAELRDLEERVAQQLRDHAAGHLRDNTVRRLARQYWLTTSIAIAAAGASIAAVIWN
jgi:hypothetical protein